MVKNKLNKTKVIMDINKLGIKKTFRKYGQKQTADAFGGLQEFVKEYGAEKVLKNIDMCFFPYSLSKFESIFGKENIINIYYKGMKGYMIILGFSRAINKFGKERVIKEFGGLDKIVMDKRLPLKNIIKYFGKENVIKACGGVSKLPNVLKSTEIADIIGLVETVKLCGVDKVIKDNYNFQNIIYSNGIKKTKLAFNIDELRRQHIKESKIKKIFEAYDRFEKFKNKPKKSRHKSTMVTKRYTKVKLIHRKKKE